MQAALAGKTLSDPAFASAVKNSMLAALIAAGVISGPGDAKWKAMSAQDAAKQLSASGLDASNVSDPVVKRALALAKQIEVETPLMDAVLYTNDLQPMHLVKLIRDTVGDLSGKRIAFLGLSFKPDTDDTRATRALPIDEVQGR